MGKHGGGSVTCSCCLERLAELVLWSVAGGCVWMLSLPLLLEMMQAGRLIYRPPTSRYSQPAATHSTIHPHRAHPAQPTTDRLSECDVQPCDSLRPNASTLPRRGCARPRKSRRDQSRRSCRRPPLASGLWCTELNAWPVGLAERRLMSIARSRLCLRVLEPCCLEGQRC